jgi:hypothetical protein
MKDPKSAGTCFWHLARRTNGFCRRDASSTLIGNPNLHSRSGGSAERRHYSVRHAVTHGFKIAASRLFG